MIVQNVDYVNNRIMTLIDGQLAWVEYPLRNLIELMPSQYTVERIPDSSENEKVED